MVQVEKTYDDDENECWYITGTYIHHREDGPALIFSNRFINWLGCEIVNKEFWVINDNNITEQVKEWIKEHDYPNWKQWDDAIKLHFKLTFIG